MAREILGLIGRASPWSPVVQAIYASPSPSITPDHAHRSSISSQGLPFRTSYWYIRVRTWVSRSSAREREHAKPILPIPCVNGPNELDAAAEDDS